MHKYIYIYLGKKSMWMYNAVCITVCQIFRDIEYSAVFCETQKRHKAASEDDLQALLHHHLWASCHHTRFFLIVQCVSVHFLDEVVSRLWPWDLIFPYWSREVGTVCIHSYIVKFWCPEGPMVFTILGFPNILYHCFTVYSILHLSCNLLFGLIGHFGLLKDVNISLFLLSFCW